MLAKVSLASDVNGAATKFNVNALGISKAVASTSGESYCVTDKMTRGAGHWQWGDGEVPYSGREINFQMLKDILHLPWMSHDCWRRRGSPLILGSDDLFWGLSHRHIASPQSFALLTLNHQFTGLTPLQPRRASRWISPPGCLAVMPVCPSIGRPLGCPPTAAPFTPHDALTSHLSQSIYARALMEEMVPNFFERHSLHQLPRRKDPNITYWTPSVNLTLWLFLF